MFNFYDVVMYHEQSAEQLRTDPSDPSYQIPVTLALNAHHTKAPPIVHSYGLFSRFYQNATKRET